VGLWVGIMLRKHINLLTELGHVKKKFVVLIIPYRVGDGLCKNCNELFKFFWMRLRAF
jgi:hypothetical protein